ncbi:zinc finger FYVE domain-containing 26 isoform X1, partial [Paramuricea clavata]
MQALKQENFHTQLDNAISDYLSRNSEIIEEEKIYLPELLKWYKNDFLSTLSDLSAETNNFNGGENWVELLLGISPYLRGEHFKNFDDIATQLNVAFTPHCWEFGFRFPTTETTIQRETSSKSDIPNAPKYTLTQALSSYLIARSPLVASLANLSCSQDSNLAPQGSQKEAEFSLLTTSLANPGTRSLEVTSPFEFAMNQAVKFPVLQRHITSAFLSVSKFLYLDGLGLTKSPQSTSVSAELATRNQSRLFLLDEQSQEVSEMFLRAVNYAWCKADWELLLEIFNSACLNQHGALHGPEDFVLEMAFMSRLETSPDDDLAAQSFSILHNFNIPAPNFNLNWRSKKWLLLYRIKDDCARAKIVLQCLHNWCDIEVCLKLLTFCLSKPPDDKELLASLEKKTKQLRLCKKIRHCHSSQGFSGIKIKYETWKDVVEHSVRNPELVLQALQDRERFDLVREWIDVYGYPSQLRERIHEDYLRYLLTKTPMDVTEVYMYLEEIEDPVKTLEICERLLSKQMPIPNTLFIIHFMITDLDAHVKPARKHALLRQRLGTNAVLCIPESNRRPYESLTSQPLLLLEQLLIDMKVEWAGKVFEDLQSELRTNRNYDEWLRKEISVEAFDELLVWYATKALEFDVVTYEDHDELVHESHNDKTKSLDTRQIKTTTPIKGHQRHASTGATRSFRRSSTNESQQSGSFKIPEKIPAEGDWEPDYKHSVCMICKEVAFNMFVRRHHCRRCGRVVCDTCSPFKRILSNSSRTPVRVCKDCDKAMFEQSYRKKEADTIIYSGSLPTYMSRSWEGRASAEFRERLDPAVPKSEDELNFDVHQGWRLNFDEECNKVIRDDFLYEQAPSSSLCTSILALHGNSKTCAKLLLELCNKLSQKLGMSEEIDNNLLISIICQLLYHAKLKFTNCGETHGVELCDTYMSRVELVKFLIESNFYELPSIEDLMSSQTARRLRDKLIENESLTLAMEVTTKCGLDAGAVWGAWGLAYLQVGKFKEARQKFSKFLK